MQITTTTERLLLDVLTEEDADFIQELVNTEGWLQFIGDRNVHSKEDALAYIQKIKSTLNLTYWVARLKETKTPIGLVSFLKRAYLDHFDIGFAFLPAYNGQGYAYEGANAILSLVRQNPEHATVLATTFPQNKQSIKLLEKLGLRFQKELEADDKKLHVYFISGPVKQNIPFQVINWNNMLKEEHKGEQGTSFWQVLQLPGLRIRIVEYAPGYLADHWCQKGHIVHCLKGSFISEFQEGGSVTLHEGISYVVSDELSSHRSYSKEGVQLLIIDGDFLAYHS